MSNPFGKYNGNELDYLRQFIETDNTLDYVKLLEYEFSQKIGGKYAIAVNSGTSALHAALVACDVKGGEVLMPALTPAMVAFAVIHAGGKPIFCDVDEDTHHISIEDAEEKWTEFTKAVLGVSLSGFPIDWSKWHTHSSFGNFWLIDDCAQALGAKNVGLADITCFSFEDKKHITTGSEGGMILTNNEELAIRARKFAGLGYKHMTAEHGRTSIAKAEYQNPDYERFDTIGLNYRMSQIQAAVGLAQLERLEHIVARRRACAKIFLENTDGKEIKQNSSYYTLPIDCPIADWKSFYNRFTIMGGDGFYAMPQLPFKEPALYEYVVSKNACPIATKLQKQLMLFKTNYRDLGKAEQQAEILAKLISEL